MLPSLPNRGIVVLYGNTLDLYEKHPLHKALEARYKTLPIVAYSSDLGWAVVKASADAREKIKAIHDEELKPYLSMPFEPPPHAYLQAMVRMLRDMKAVAIVDYAETLLGASEWKLNCISAKTVPVILRAADSELEGLLIIVMRDRLAVLHPALRESHAFIHFARVPLPNETERDEVKPKLGRQTGGLTVRQLRDSTDGNWTEIQAKVIARRSGGSLHAEWPETEWDWIGGLAPIKRALKEEILPAFLRADRYSPMGIIQAGPPGTGKSAMAEAISHMLKRPLYTWGGGMVTSSYVGENESRLAAALEVLDETGGVIYFDEGDKMFSHPDAYQGDSGVQLRLTGMLHEFLSKPARRGKSIAIMSVNRPYALPSSMRRAGRFDIVLPFIPPIDEAERVEIMLALARRHTLTDVPKAVWEYIAEHTTLWVGSDLEAVMMALARMAKGPTLENAKSILEHMRPAVPREIMLQMTNDTIEECRDDRLLPPREKLLELR